MQKRLIVDRYFRLEVKDCPISIVEMAAKLGYENVTIENFSQDYAASTLVQAKLLHNGVIDLKLKSYLLDFTLTKSNFISLLDIWDVKGCYAIFHQTPLIKFKATDLTQPARYKALDNFKWNLEVSIPSGASDGWGYITSPDESIIDKLLAELLQLEK